MSQYEVKLKLRGDFDMQTAITRLHRIIAMWNSLDVSLQDYEFTMEQTK